MIGTQFTQDNGTTYQITKIDELEGLQAMQQQLEKHGKEPRMYHAAKVLKNGKLSEKVGGVFYRFNTGRFLQI